MLISGQKFSKQNSIFDMFRSGGGGQPQQAPQNQPQQQPLNGGGTGGNVNVPNGTGQQTPNTQQQQQQQPNSDDTNKSPLAEFTGLWDSPPAPKEGEAIPPDWNDHGSIVPKINVDPKKLMESARKIDFSRALNQDRVKAALGGDIGAFNEVINSALQASFANQAMTMSRMAETMMAQMAEKLYSGALPHHFHKHQVNQTIDSENPIFTDPAVAPMLEMVKGQMQLKYPKASAKEISDMAKKYISGFATAVSGGKGDGGVGTGKPGKGGNNNAGGEGMDWLAFADMSTPTQQ